MPLVEVWGLQDGIAVAGEVAEALIVGHDDEDVGLLVLRGREHRKGGEQSDCEQGAPGQHGVSFTI